MRRSHRLGSAAQRGAVAGIEALPLGFVLFVAGTLFVLNVWAVIDAKFAVINASREATRAYVEANDEQSANDDAIAAAVAALDAHRRGDPSRVTIDPAELSAPFGRCARVTITVHYRVPALVVPWLGGLGHGIESSATHSEAVDAYRGGIDGGGCP